MEEEVESGGGYRLRGNRKGKGVRARQSKKGGALTAGAKSNNRGDRVHCARQAVYWGGMVELIQGYWMGYKISVWIVWINRWQYAVSARKRITLLCGTDMVIAGAVRNLCQGWQTMCTIPGARPDLCWVHKGQALMFLCAQDRSGECARQEPIQPGSRQVFPPETDRTGNAGRAVVPGTTAHCRYQLFPWNSTWY